MTGADKQRHWESVYGSRRSTEVSWYQPRPERSLQLIIGTGVPADTPIIDVGGGASTLVDHLLDEGYRDVTVLDIAANAFGHSGERLGPRADDVEWIVADVTRFEPQRSYGLWHDRAVLHFLTDASDRDRYVQALDKALSPGAHLVLSTFGPQGPLKCSGLDVRRYDIDMLTDLVGERFELQRTELETHTTPGGAKQQFLYSSWTRRDVQLETARLLLQRITADDVGLMLAVWNDPAFVEHVGDRGIRTEDEAQSALDAGILRLYRDYGYGPFKMVRKDDGALLGICGLFKRDNLDDPDIGFAVLPAYYRQGYSIEAARAVVAHARDDLGVPNLTAIVSPRNTASIRLLEKLGLTFSRMITMPGDDEAICLYEMSLEQG